MIVISWIISKCLIINIINNLKKLKKYILSYFKVINRNVFIINIGNEKEVTKENIH